MMENSKKLKRNLWRLINQGRLFWCEWSLKLYNIMDEFMRKELRLDLNHACNNKSNKFHSRTHAHNDKCALLSTVMSSPVLGNGFQRWMFPFLWVPELPLCHSHSNSRPTDQLQTFHCHTKLYSCAAYSILALTRQKTPFLCCCAIIAFLSAHLAHYCGI
jgi:hypothetical protein